MHISLQCLSVFHYCTVHYTVLPCSRLYNYIALIKLNISTS